MKIERYTSIDFSETHSKKVARKLDKKNGPHVEASYLKSNHKRDPRNPKHTLSFFPIRIDTEDLVEKEEEEQHESGTVRL